MHCFRLIAMPWKVRRYWRAGQHAGDARIHWLAGRCSGRTTEAINGAFAGAPALFMGRDITYCMSLITKILLEMTLLI